MDIYIYHIMTLLWDLLEKYPNYGTNIILPYQ